MKKAFVSLIAFILAPFGVAQAQENGTSAANDTTTAWVEMTTNKGVMLIEIDKKNAPLTAANFISYVENGFFDGLIFHRVIPGFVIQGGGFSPEMKQKETAAPIQNEAGNGLKNLRYSLSMARTNDPHSATSQFFINLNDNGNLDRSPSNPGYAVFGKVVEGQEVVDAIAAAPTKNVGPFADVPATSVIIEKAIIVEKKSAQ